MDVSTQWVCFYFFVWGGTFVIAVLAFMCHVSGERLEDDLFTSNPAPLYVLFLSAGLIDCYLASNGIREAMGMANNIYKTLGANAQTLTILATVCLEDPMTQEKAKTLLDKALAQRPDYIKAVVKKAELLSK